MLTADDRYPELSSTAEPPGATGGTALQQPSPTSAKVWVRRCNRCGIDDLRSAFGRLAVIDDRPWRCPVCAATDWRPAGVDSPSAPDVGCCPYGEGRM